MATVGLSIAGSAAGGPVGAFVGGLVGAFIDQTLLFPAIFGDNSQDFTGPRLDSLQAQRASEGGGVKYLFGPENRVAGNLIWQSDLIEVVKKVSGPGKGGGGGNKQTVYRYFAHIAIAWCEGPIESVDAIWADGKLIWEKNTPTTNADIRYDGITHYDGTQTTPDSLIQSDPNYDSADIPAFNGIAFSVIEMFSLADFGNRVPNFTALIRKDAELTVANALKAILVDRGGWDDEEVDVSRVDGCLRGYVVLGPTEISKQLEPLTLAFNLLAQEVNGVLTFFHRGEQEEIIVSDEILSARAFGEPLAFRPARFSNRPGTDMPSEVSVRYTDPTIDYQDGAQAEKSVATGIAPLNNPEEIQLPIVLAPEQARVIARRLLWSTLAERMRAEIVLPPSFYGVAEGDIVSFPLNGLTESIRVQRASFGRNGLIEIEGVVQDDSVFSQIATAESGETNAPPPVVVTPLDWHAFECAPLTVSVVGSSGIYYAGAPLFPGKAFPGGAFYDGPSSGGPFTEIDSISEGTIGRATTILRSGPLGTIDYTNTVSITLPNGNLSSVTDDELFAGANRAAVGKEIIGFKTATPVGSNGFILSGLLRGLRNTADHRGSHIVGERFALLDPDEISFAPISTSLVGQPRFGKAVSVGGIESATASRAYSYTNRAMRALPPKVWYAKRLNTSTSQSIVLRWSDRTRYPMVVLAADPNPVPEIEAETEVAIWDQASDEWDVLTTTDSGAYTVAYAAWNTRGYAANDPVDLRLTRKESPLDSLPVYLRVADPTLWPTSGPGPDPILASLTPFDGTEA